MKRILILLAALIGFASPAHAWWEYGHQTVAAIAYRNVTPQVRATIGRMLAQSGPLLDTPECPTGTIEQASVWADCVKKLGDRFRYAYTWHFQDVNICKPFDLKPPCKDGNCVSAQIEREVKLLKDKGTPVRDRVQALVFLIHFVGDLHQPLHAGEMDDAGGNKLKASYGIYATDRLNLHSIWDGLLAERAISTPPSLVRVHGAAERRAVQAGTVTDWSRESWQVARDVVYRSALGRDPCVGSETPVKLDEATIASLVPAARLQVERGGLRLAKLLNEALG
ncbi:S1/P1 nuclease [Sphingomonas sp. dw_22]|uniref:S1/P1 nuclease n=1 Tax=Sphingomonas sp. dw_22 TaxID=2721175 RepID=UPI001BD44F5B